MGNEVKKFKGGEISSTALIWRILPVMESILRDHGDEAPLEFLNLQHDMIDCVRNEGAALNAVGNLVKSSSELLMVLKNDCNLNDEQILDQLAWDIGQVTDCLAVGVSSCSTARNEGNEGDEVNEGDDLC